MRLKPRQYFLLALILLVAAFQLYRVHRIRQRAAEAAAIPTAPPLAPTTAADPAAWAAFDKAAALRDAPDDTFLPALKAVPTDTNSDIDGCRTWLLFYRQGRLHPSNDPAWSTRSNAHLNGCTKLHRDTSA